MRAVETARKMGHAALDEPSGKKILKAAGIRVPRSVVVPVGKSLRAAVSDLHAPYVLKVVATGVVHKSDVGGVRLNLRTPEEAEAAAAQVRASLQERGILGNTFPHWSGRCPCRGRSVR